MGKLEQYQLLEDFVTSSQCAWIDINGTQPYDSVVKIKSGTSVLKVAEGRYLTVGAGGDFYVDIPDDVVEEI